MLKQLLIISYATLLFCGLAFTGVAQTISAVAVTNTSGTPTNDYCTGQSARVSFTRTGFAGTPTFSVQISNASGTFSATLTADIIGTGTTSPISVNLPGTAGAAYKVRVISGATVSAASTQTLQISGPPSGPPTTSTTVNFCQNQSPSTLSATATGGNTVVWYQSDNATKISSGAPSPNTAVGGNTTYTYYVTQANAGGCEYSPRTQITVNVNVTPAPTVTQPTVNYCQGDGASALTANGSNLKWYTASSGGTGNTTAPTPNTAAAGTQLFYVSQTINGCESNSRAQITVNVNQRASSAPATNANPTFCQGQFASPLSATASGGNTIRWYASNNSTLLGSAPTPNTNVNSTTTTDYYVTQASAAGCEFAPRTKVTVTVNYTAPPQISGGFPILACQNVPAAPLSDNVSAASGNSLLWYGTLSSGGSGSGTATVPNTAGVGQTTYYVTQRNPGTGCESSPRTGVIVQTNAVPNAPSVTSPVNICLNSGASPLSASASGGASLLWWGTNASGGASSSTAPTPATGSTGTTVYYVSQRSNNCESSRAPITVTINSIPAEPTVPSTTLLYCKDATATPISATAAGGNTLRWYNGNSFIGTTAPTPSTNVGSTATTTYNVSQISAAPANCESPKVQIITTVYVSSAPGISAIAYCQNAPAVALTANTASGAGVNWYTTPSGGTPTGTAPTPSTATVGSVSFYVSQTQFAATGFAGCESPRATLTVTTNPLPLAPTAGNPAPYCQTYGASPLTATGNSLKWYTVSTGGTSTTVAPTPSTANAGSVNYYVSQTNNFNCEGPRAQITVTINPTPARPGVNPIQYCQNASAVALNASADAGNTLKWYGTNASGGTSNSAAPTPSTTTPGETSFYVSQTNSFTCESPRGQLIVTIRPTPGNPGATTPIFYCNTATTQPLSANGENLRWYNEPSGGTGSGVAPSPSTGTVGTSSFYVTQTNQFNCESPRTEVKVTIKPLPPFPTVPKQEYLLCQFDQSVQLDAQLAGTGQSLVWTLPNNNETGAAPVITTEAGFVGTFSVLQVLDGCRGPRTEIRVNVRTTPLPAVSAVPVVSCQNSTPQPLEATGTNLKWYNTNRTGGTPQTTPNIPPTQTPGTYQFYVTQTGTNTCESPRAEITVVIQPLPSATLTGGGTITQGQPTNLTIAFTGQGPWTYTLSNGLTLTTNQNPVTIQAYPLETTVYNVTKITNNCGEGTPAGSASIEVKIATIDVGNPNATTVCAGQSFSIPYFSSDFFPSSTQFRVQISKSTDDAGFQTIPTEGNNSPIRATLPNATSGGTYYIRVIGLASVAGNSFTIKGKLSPVQINVRELPTATLSGPTRVYENENAKLAIAFTGETPWRITYRDSLATKDTTFTTSATPYEFSVRPGKTNTYSVVSISNGCGNGPATSKFVLIVDPVLGVEPTLGGEWLKVYPVPVQARCTIEIDGTGGQTVSFTITDGLGRIILRQQTSSNKDEMDMSQLAPGMYFLNAEREGQIARRKILKVQ
jgi:Ig-like domain CHU_C associated/Secretion system C-terminal sorting domain